MTLPLSSYSDTALILATAFTLLVPLAWGGISLINTGLGRSRSAAHSMLASLCVVSVAAIAYFVCGFAWQGFIGQPSRFLVLGGRQWNLIGAGRFFLLGMRSDSTAVPVVFLLQVFCAGLAALIPLGSGTDRWRLGAICASTAFLAGWTYPLFAHWVWGGGWLAQLGVNYGLGRGYVDVGGSGTIQALGGLSALSITWALGPRKGKYGRSGMPAAIPGHNAVLVLFGCVLALLGWLGLNSAGAILFAGVDPKFVALVAVNTLLCATSAALTAVVTTRLRFGRPDASLAANGWVGGLAASSAGCAFVAPAAAVIIGLVAGVLVILAVELLELHLRVDDPCGSVAAHGIAGIWGVLAVGVFANLSKPANGESAQWLAQLVGVATLLGFVLPLTYGFHWLLNRIYPLRVTADGESQGLDVHELGADAYPEFVSHTEDFG